MISSFWTQVWSQHQDNEEAAANKLVRDFGVVDLSFTWEPVSLEDLWEAVRQAKGAAGVDGWDVPLPAIQIFHQCTLRWYESGCLPDQMSESKQVCIPKVNKISENNTLKVQDVRPISILSIFWRIYSSAWVKSDQVKKWTKRYLHDKVAHGKGAQGAEELIELLQSECAGHRKGYLTSLD